MYNPYNDNRLPENRHNDHVDIVDRYGNYTGETKPRWQVHRDGDFHRSAHVWITDGKRVLLQKRSSLKDTFAGKWDVSAAGHVDAGEEVEQTAVRECGEELGVQVRREDLNYVGTLIQNHVTETIRDNELATVYVVSKTPPLHTLRIQTEEVCCVVYASFLCFNKLTRSKDSRLVPHEQEYKMLLEYMRHM